MIAHDYRRGRQLHDCPQNMVIFIPLWLFHAVVARYRFTLPALSSPQSCQISCHSIVSTPLLVAFELLLFVYLEGINGHGEYFIDLKLFFHFWLWKSLCWLTISGCVAL